MTSLAKLIHTVIYHCCTNKIHSLFWHICQANIRKSNHRSLHRCCVNRWTSTSSISGSNSLALILCIITLIEVLGLVWFCSVAKQHRQVSPFQRLPTIWKLAMAFPLIYHHSLKNKAMEGCHSLRPQQRHTTAAQALDNRNLYTGLFSRDKHNL